MNEKFNQMKYQEDWKKKNMKRVSALFKNEFVDEFKNACNKLGISQSDVFRQAMIETIEKAAK